MIKHMNKNEMVHILLADEYADWSYEGASALIEWLEELEENTGTPSVFDPVAMRCEFTEYASWDSVCATYEMEEQDIRDRTICIDYGSSKVIISEF